MNFKNKNVYKERKNCVFKKKTTKLKGNEDWLKMKLIESEDMMKRKLSAKDVLMHITLNLQSSFKWKLSLSRGRKKKKQPLRSEKHKKKQSSG